MVLDVYSTNGHNSSQTTKRRLLKSRKELIMSPWRQLYSQAIYVSFSFLAANVIILLLVLRSNRRRRNGNVEDSPKSGVRLDSLDSSDILGLEFEYARITASEAMRDRHTMMNYYLLIVGIASTGVINILKSDKYQHGIGTMILWILCGVGWFYFLKIVRLREAWYDSAQTMCKIKDFYVEHSENPTILKSAFRWRTQTLPRPDRPWTLYFLSAMLIAFLDSVAYAAGGILISAETMQYTVKQIWPTIVAIVVFCLIFFAFHAWLYFRFLGHSGSNASSMSKGNDNHRS